MNLAKSSLTSDPNADLGAGGPVAREAGCLSSRSSPHPFSSFWCIAEFWGQSGMGMTLAALSRGVAKRGVHASLNVSAIISADGIGYIHRKGAKARRKTTLSS